jgi:DNA-directed RNA polymerase specialized sigma24 family protein
VGLFDGGPTEVGDRAAIGEARVGERISNTGTVGIEDEVTGAISLRQALEMLPEDQRNALRLRHELDLDYAEIAAIVQVPIGTVRSRISRGRSALLRALDKQYDDLATGRGERNHPPASGVEREERHE